MNKPIRGLLAACLLTSLTLGTAPRSGADTLYLRDGEQMPGNLKSMTADAVVFQTRDGDKTVPKDGVNRVQLQRQRQFDDVVKTDQITDPDLKAALAAQVTEQQYPADGAVVLLQRRTLDLSEPGFVKETVRAITKILRQRGEETAQVNVWYFDDTDQPQIDFALTVTPDGRVLHLDDAALKSESVYASLPDYRRLSRYRFVCKEPRAGSVFDVQYTVVRKRDTATEPFYAEDVFRIMLPVLRKEVVVKAPADREVAVDTAQADPAVLEGPVRTVDGANVQLVWTLKVPQAGLKEEPYMPPLRMLAPSIAVGPRTTLQEIAGVYTEVLAKLPPLPDDVKAKAVELAKQGGARAIYNHVVRSVRTVPVAQAQFRMTPHAPGDVVKRGLANELDKNVLYFKMLEAAGIPSSFALVRDRIQGPAPTGVCSLRAFGRCAVYLPLERKFSTTVNDKLSFDVLPAEFQGGSALLANADARALLPIARARPEQELTPSTVEATLSDSGDLEMTVTYHAIGNAEAGLRAPKDLDDQRLRNQMEQMAGTLHSSAVLKDFKKTDLADLDVPPSLTLTCSVPGYAVKAGEDLLLFNLPGVEYDAGDVGSPEREYPLFFPHVGSDRTTVTVHLPSGYKVYSLPGKAKFKSKTAAYKAKFKKQANTLVFTDDYRLNVDCAPATAYPDYKHCKELRADLARKRVILMKTK